MLGFQQGTDTLPDHDPILSQHESNAFHNATHIGTRGRRAILPSPAFLRSWIMTVKRIDVFPFCLQ
jgi:hypothetical protein